MKKIKIALNADIGEGMDNDEKLMPFLTYVNIACGGHAGNKTTIRKTIQLAKSFQVKIGAHPSYPDIENFGRKPMQFTKKELSEILKKQMHLFLAEAEKEFMEMYHIKLHGALYNETFSNEKNTQWFIDWVRENYTNTKIFLPVATQFFHLKNTENVVYEAFADRNYKPDLSLVSRNKTNAVSQNVAEVVKHVDSIINKKKIITINGKEIQIKADTLCLHGDHPKALDFAEAIRKITIDGI